MAFTTRNAVAELKKLCFERNWPEPTYGAVTSSGPQQYKTYVCGLKLRNITTFGLAVTKNSAKIDAAMKALAQLRLESAEQEPSSKDKMQHFKDVPIVWPTEETFIEVRGSNAPPIFMSLEGLKFYVNSIAGLSYISGESIVSPITGQREPFFFILRATIFDEKIRIESYGKTPLHAEKNAFAKLCVMY